MPIQSYVKRRFEIHSYILNHFKSFNERGLVNERKAYYPKIL